MPRHILNTSAVKNEKLNEALSVLESLGATVVDNIQFSEFNKDYYGTNPDEWELAFLVEQRESAFPGPPVIVG